MIYKWSINRPIEMAQSEREKRQIHLPIFLNEILENLVQPGGFYIDGTLGDGGHSKALLEKSGPKSRLAGIDLDTEGLRRAEKELADFGDRVSFFHNTFANLQEVTETLAWQGKVTGILFDLGMSTHHLQTERGFSFKNSGSLDMRFDPTGKIALPLPTLNSLKRVARNIPNYTTKDLLNLLHEDELQEIIELYGEEKFGERIAVEIVAERRNGDIQNVAQLVSTIVRAYPASQRHGRIHVATRTFQALRIAVNREYETVEIGIKQALQALKSGGRLAIISFHSGEDRVVKQAFKKAGATKQFNLLTKHPIKPTYQEVQANAWSRSAKLRIIEKT